MNEMVVSETTQREELPILVCNSDLATACERWSAAGMIGIDTEFVRERTFYPLPGLVAVADRDGVVLVDPIAVSDFGPLRALITDPSVTKLMHACDEDLDLLELLTGAMPRGVLDTQLAAAFAGYGFSRSYGDMVEVLLDVELDKGLTRSDWTRRPLSPEQLHYAALDVAYLLTIYERLSGELEALNRVSWFTEECENQQRARFVGKRPDRSHLRIRGRGKLLPAWHAVLRALSQWRELTAMARDIPRRHLVSDESLLTMASKPVLETDSSKSIQGLPKHLQARYGEEIAECINSARARGPDSTDTPINLRPHAGTLTRLKALVRGEAEAQRLPPELLASRRALETFLISVLSGDELPQLFRGWRLKVITKTLQEASTLTTPVGNAGPSERH